MIQNLSWSQTYNIQYHIDEYCLEKTIQKVGLKLVDKNIDLHREIESLINIAQDMDDQFSLNYCIQFPKYSYLNDIEKIKNELITANNQLKLIADAVRKKLIKAELTQQEMQIFQEQTKNIQNQYQIENHQIKELSNQVQLMQKEMDNLKEKIHNIQQNFIFQSIENIQQNIHFFDNKLYSQYQQNQLNQQKHFIDQIKYNNGFEINSLELINFDLTTVPNKIINEESDKYNQLMQQQVQDGFSFLQLRWKNSKELITLNYCSKKL